MGNRVQILTSNKIDATKWDNCIEKSSNSLIYADYSFLTNQCDHWSGLIINDYQTILPLPWRRKWGIKYLYAPTFTQQLGFFGDLSIIHFPEILKHIQKFAKYGDLFFNYQNRDILNQIECEEKTNYVLNLENPYPKTFSNYSKELIKNLQKSQKHKLTYAIDFEIEDAIQQFYLQYQNRFVKYNYSTFRNLSKTCLELSGRNKCITRYVYNATTNEVLSIALLLKDEKRLYLLLNSTNPNGRIFAANHFLLDQIIQEFSEEALLFDFEGSERKGIREFYESFHPECQLFFHYRFNKLPFLINWIRIIAGRLKISISKT